MYFIGLLVIALIPIQPLLFWLFNRSRDIQNKLDTHPSSIRLSRLPFLYGVVFILLFLKGYGIPYLTDRIFFYNDLFLLISIVSTLGFHFFSPFNRFKPQPFWFVVFSGVSLFLDKQIGISIIIMSLIFTLVFNSMLIGPLVSLFIALFLSWIWGFPTVYLTALLCSFCIIFLALNEEAILYFSKNPLTLYQQFKKRR